MRTIDGMSVPEINDLERRIIAAETGRDHFGQAVRSVRIDARTARTLFDRASFDPAFLSRSEQRINELQRELTKAEAESLNRKNEIAMKNHRIEELQRQIRMSGLRAVAC